MVGNADAVWALLTDISLPTRFSPELQEVEWLDGASEVAVGARFRGRNANEHLGEWVTECEVIENEPGRRWVWQVHGTEGIMATWGFELDPGRDSLTISQWARLGPAPSGVSIFIAAKPDREGRIIAGRLEQWREAMTITLEGVKQLVEGESSNA